MAKSRSDWARMNAMSDEEINETSPPELKDIPAKFWEQAPLRIVRPEPGRPLVRRQRQSGLARVEQRIVQLEVRVGMIGRAPPIGFSDTLANRSGCAQGPGALDGAGGNPLYYLMIPFVIRR